MELAIIIRDIREELRLSQAEVARRMEVDPPTYHRLEKRGEKLSVEQLTHIARAFELSVVEILTWGPGRAIWGQRESIKMRDDIDMEDDLRAEIYDLKTKLDRANGVIDALVFSFNKERELKEARERYMKTSSHEDLEEKEFEKIKRDHEELIDEAKGILSSRKNEA